MLFTFTSPVHRLTLVEKPDVKNCLPSGMEGHQVIIKLTIIRSIGSRYSVEASQSMLALPTWDIILDIPAWD